MQHLPLKEEFIEKYKKLTDYPEFEKYIQKFQPKALRVNTIKTTVPKIKKSLSYLNLKPIPWIKEGFWIQSEKRDLGNTLEHQLGYIYIQEAASMIPPLALNPQPKDVVLDMCASPGSKTTQIAMMMNNQGLIVANEKDSFRTKPLVSNLQRCGVSNTVVTVKDARSVTENFNKILLDAPCSSSGTLRGLNQRNLKTALTWKPGLIKSITGIQRKLILKAYEILNKKGTLIYSTCSLDPEEDEAVIQFLLDNTDAKLEKINLKIKSEINLEYQDQTFSSELNKCIKLWPQFYDTEGFFIAKITKP